MTAVAICSVGSELTSGDQVDTNAAWLSQRVSEVGGHVVAHLAVGDDLDAIVAALTWLAERAELVLVGGGLGPTPDDLTREAIAAAFDRPLGPRADLEEQVIQAFASRGVRMPASNLRQAELPAGATGYAPVGTAPGFRLDLEEGPTLYVLPGVPWEMRAMFERDVLPDLVARSDGVVVTRVLHVSGMGEASVAETAEPVASDLPDGVQLAYLATGRDVLVKVVARAGDLASARELAAPVVADLADAIGPAVAGVDDVTLEEAVCDLLRAARQTVATAESATAGDICSRLAAVPGTSDVLRGGVVVYATDAKTEQLGVPAELIEQHGPVSEPVTRELALRVRERFGSDWGIAVTGVAGPATQGGQEVGTSFWAVATPDGTVECRGTRFTGDREAVRTRLGSAALELLRRHLTRT